MRRGNLAPESLGLGLLFWLSRLASLCQGLSVGPQRTCGPVLSVSVGLSVAGGQSERAGGADARGSRLTQVPVMARSVQSLSARVPCQFP